jgi:phosphatidylglycerol---prolipoprotein diacylglyceryl transferase
MILHWSFDPIAFSLGPLTVRWYGLLFVGGFFAGQLLLARMFKAEGVAPGQAERLLMYALLGSVAGARLVHCLFYEPAYYLSDPLAILRIWEGGLASHGGLIGLVIGLWLGGRGAQPAMPLPWLLDRVTIPGMLAAVCIRVANFLNAEIVGEPTGSAWGVVFEAIDAVPRHPAQLYEAAAYGLIFVVLTLVYRREDRRPATWLLTGLCLLLTFAARIGIEFFKTPQAAHDVGQQFSVGQWLSLPFVLIGAVLVVRALRRP